MVPMFRHSSATYNGPQTPNGPKCGPLKRASAVWAVPDRTRGKCRPCRGGRSCLGPRHLEPCASSRPVPTAAVARAASTRRLPSTVRTTTSRRASSALTTFRVRRGVESRRVASSRTVRPGAPSSAARASRCLDPRPRLTAVFARRSLRRSRSLVPPQIPKCSVESRAKSRHASRTGQRAQTALASATDSPRAG